MPDEIEFIYDAGTGSVYASYQSGEKYSLELVTGNKFAADLASFNEVANRAVTNSDINRIIARIYKQALKEVGKVPISPPRYKTREKT